jgi:hypothetical protein
MLHNVLLRCDLAEVDVKAWDSFKYIFRQKKQNRKSAYERAQSHCADNVTVCHIAAACWLNVLPVLAVSVQALHVALTFSTMVTSRSSLSVAQLRQSSTCDVVMTDRRGYGALFVYFYYSIWM